MAQISNASPGVSITNWNIDQNQSWFYDREAAFLENITPLGKNHD